MIRPLSELTQTDDFVRRHIGPSDADVDAMLDTLDLGSLDDLIAAAVPESIQLQTPLALHEPQSETTVVARLRDLAARNQVYTSMIGMGYHGTITPAVIQRNILENPGWYTAYTPYQPEISQGRLEALLNFQTMVIDLTGMEIANASLLDEATAAAEAMTMLHRVATRGSDVFFVDADCHPQTINVLLTRAAPLGIKVVVGDPHRDLLGGGSAPRRTASEGIRGDEASAEGPVSMDPYGALLQYPGTSGAVRDDAALIAELKAAGVMVAVAADLLALTLLIPPGEMGADVVVGTTQRFGVPLMFGGPHAAYMATRDEHKRTLPGRLVGVSKDTKDRMALRLALTTREQHIRRERATSNICTAQVLLAIIAGAYAVYHGPDGLRTIAERTHRLTSILAAGLSTGGVEIVNGTWFDTLTVRTSGPAAEVLAAARARRINLRPVDDETVGISLDERTTVADVAELFAVFGLDDTVAGHEEAPDGIPDILRRTTGYLTHPVFHRYRSETGMLRYLRKLQQKDIALDRSMIPLGSCTLKLNATTEMLPITWPEFADIHPYAPLNQVAGYLELIDELERWLGELTGYDAVSLQPNAGSQGEYAGLLAIRGYHQSRGEGHRHICLIPASAHGTNPASATMAGLQVVVVATDDAGNIDLADLEAKAEEHAHDLAALMITYPSTHGVFEAEIRQVCDIVHGHGGQVYIDGANLNALVGVAKLADLGGDVSHLNLHKTFTIPHGGGGPGVGPIGVRRHLEPFLPGDPIETPDGEGATHRRPVTAAPWGSAGILPISWAYIALMGGSGLTRATQVAVLNANYVAKRLEGHYPVLYTGPGGYVAHECILDVRHLKRDPGVSVDDFAKRLIDYGFHAPTMSFPVPGTLMVEPTESESLAELERFIEAMIAIEGEVDRVASGEWPVSDNPLVNAPHPAEDVVVDDWDHPYRREVAAYPSSASLGDKYWPPVSRIDDAYGDRHVVCACPPIEEYQ